MTCLECLPKYLLVGSRLCAACAGWHASKFRLPSTSLHTLEIQPCLEWSWCCRRNACAACALWSRSISVGMWLVGGVPLISSVCTCCRPCGAGSAPTACCNCVSCPNAAPQCGVSAPTAWCAAADLRHGWRVMQFFIQHIFYLNSIHSNLHNLVTVHTLLTQLETSIDPTCDEVRAVALCTSDH